MCVFVCVTEILVLTVSDTLLVIPIVLLHFLFILNLAKVVCQCYYSSTMLLFYQGFTVFQLRSSYFLTE